MKPNFTGRLHRLRTFQVVLAFLKLGFLALAFHQQATAKSAQSLP